MQIPNAATRHFTVPIVIVAITLAGLALVLAAATITALGTRTPTRPVPAAAPVATSPPDRPAAVPAADGPAAATGDPFRVAVVGDSLVEFAEQGSPLQADQRATHRFIRAGARHQWRMAVVGHHGWTTADLLDDIRRQARRADAVVVVAGSNDAARIAAGQATPAQVQGWIRAAVDALAPARCAVWATVTTSAPTFYWPTPAAPESVNELIAAEAAQHPNLHIVDWAATATQPGMLLADGLHHTPAGTEAMVTDLTAAAARCLQGSPV
ncbi:MAG: hypothetical protein JNK12_12440 [Acidimicrobiales bacterium]|nr:hypothetical protein [Acidimicrobiales bacterium]